MRPFDPGFAIALAILVPLVGAGLIALTGRWPNVREAVTLVTSAALFALVASLYPMVAAGTRPALKLFDLVPGISFAFEVEPLGMLFALVASFLWILTSVYAFGYMRAHGEANQTRFYSYFAVALASTMGVAFAGNMLTLFLFYEALTLSTYPLVTHSGTDEARRAGRLYLGLLLGTSIAFLLLAVGWTWVLAGTLDFSRGGIFSADTASGAVGLLLVLYVFGIGKAALMPFHRWLPAAMVAPTPVSALLHAVAVVKTGVFAVLKVSLYIFGWQTLAGLTAADIMMYVAAATLVIAALVALRQDNLKLRLAYSTVSQLAYIVLGAMLASGWGTRGAALHIATHAFAKITLFFCAGAIMLAAQKTEVSEMRGIGRRMPITMTAFALASLSIIGMPPLGGLWSKWQLALGTVDAGEYAMLGVLMLGSLLSAGYLLPMVVRAFLGADRVSEGSARVAIREAPAMCVVPLSLTALGCVALFLWPGPILELLSGLAPVAE